jgi:hypothetical protein
MIEYGPVSRPLCLDEAILYVTFLDHNGHSDWRFPTDKEVYTHPNKYLLANFWLARDINGYWQNTQLRVLPVRGAKPQDAWAQIGMKNEIH